MLSADDVTFFDKSGNKIDGIEQFSLSVDSSVNRVIASFYKNGYVSCCVLGVSHHDALQIKLDYGVDRGKYDDIDEAVNCINRMTTAAINNMRKIIVKDLETDW